MSNNSYKIRSLNDQFRKTFHGGKLMMTTGIQSLGDDAVALILLSIQDFENFTRENDLHGEHDFGSFKHDGEKIFWKIDYYDKTMEFASPDPTDPKVTTRVLTVLLASEY